MPDVLSLVLSEYDKRIKSPAFGLNPIVPNLNANPAAIAAARPAARRGGGGGGGGGGGTHILPSHPFQRPSAAADAARARTYEEARRATADELYRMDHNGLSSAENARLMASRSAASASRYGADQRYNSEMARLQAELARQGRASGADYSAASGSPTSGDTGGPAVGPGDIKLSDPHYFEKLDALEKASAAKTLEDFSRYRQPTDDRRQTDSLLPANQMPPIQSFPASDSTGDNPFDGVGQGGDLSPYDYADDQPTDGGQQYYYFGNDPQHGDTYFDDSGNIYNSQGVVIGENQNAQGPPVDPPFRIDYDDGGPSTFYSGPGDGGGDF